MQDRQADDEPERRRSSRAKRLPRAFAPRAMSAGDFPVRWFRERG
jgi:hypothetical protein